MKPRTSDSGQLGFTLLETVVAVALSAILFGAALTASMQMTDEMNTAVAETDLDRSLRKVIDRLSSDVASSGVDEGGNDYVQSHPRDQDTELDSITFAQRIALEGEATDWSDMITYELAVSGSEIPGNDVDDDGDFLVDEQQLVRVQAGTTEIIADSVLSLNVMRVAGEDRVSFTVQIGKGVGYGHDPLVHDVSTVVSFRNR